MTRQFNFDFVPKPTEIIPFLQRTDSVLPYVVSPVLCSLLESCVTVYALKKYHPIMPADPTGLNVLGVLLSLTTVFRTQQAYSRYWESRGHLGQLMAAASTRAGRVGRCVGRRAARRSRPRAPSSRALKLYFAQVEHCLQEATHATKARSDYRRPAEKNAAESRELLRFRADADLDGSVSDDEAATASSPTRCTTAPDEAHALGRLRAHAPRACVACAHLAHGARGARPARRRRDGERARGSSRRRSARARADPSNSTAATRSRRRPSPRRTCR